MFPILQDLPTKNQAENSLNLKGELVLGDSSGGYGYGDVKEGLFKLLISTADVENPWGERIKAVEFMHESISNPAYKDNQAVGIDDGTFVASIYYDENAFVNEVQKDFSLGATSYSIVKTDDQATLVCSSGLGDGYYQVLTAEEDGLITAFKILF